MVRTIALFGILCVACIAAQSGPPVPLSDDTDATFAAAARAVEKQQQGRMEALAEAESTGVKTPSYPSCVALCTSQKRALGRQQLTKSAPAPAPKAKNLSQKQQEIAKLLAAKQSIVERLKVLSASKRTARHPARRLLSANALNTARDERRAHDLASYAKNDDDAAEARKIRRLLRERTRLLAYLHPSKGSSKNVEAPAKDLSAFHSRLSQLPFQISHDTDCKSSCKAVRTSSPKRTAAKAGAKLQKKYGEFSACNPTDNMMIMPPDFPVRVVDKGDCNTCNSVCSALKFSSPWRRDFRGSCSVRAEGDILDRYMRNYQGEVTLNLCTPMKGYDNFVTGTPTVNGFNGNEGYVGAPAHTRFEEAMNSPGCCGNDIDLYANSCAKYTACECDCCIYVWCNDNPYTWRY